MGTASTKVNSFLPGLLKPTTGSTSAFAGYYKADVEKRVHDQDTIKSNSVLNFHRKMFRGGRVLLKAIVLR